MCHDFEGPLTLNIRSGNYELLILDTEEYDLLIDEAKWVLHSEPSQGRLR